MVHTLVYIDSRYNCLALDKTKIHNSKTDSNLHNRPPELLQNAKHGPKFMSFLLLLRITILARILLPANPRGPRRNRHNINDSSQHSSWMAQWTSLLLPPSSNHESLISWRSGRIADQIEQVAVSRSIRLWRCDWCGYSDEWVQCFVVAEKRFYK